MPHLSSVLLSRSCLPSRCLVNCPMLAYLSGWGSPTGSCFIILHSFLFPIQNFPSGLGPASYLVICVYWTISEVFFAQWAPALIVLIPAVVLLWAIYQWICLLVELFPIINSISQFQPPHLSFDSISLGKLPSSTFA